MNYLTETYPPKLHIVTPIFNPRRYKRRYELYNNFAKMVEDAGAVLHTVEVALGERDFVVTEPDNPRHHQFRSRDEWFVKENLINLGFKRLPKDAKYIAWVDADISFVNPQWATETIEMLQHHPVVQMYSQVVNLKPNNEPFQLWNGFGASFDQDRDYRPIGKDYNYWHPGFAWAYRREALESFGGLLDRILLGSADSHMAASLIGKARSTVHGKTSDSFKKYVYDWEEKVQKYMKYHGYTIGYVPGLITHYWHGQMKNRKYAERWEILVKHGFDPYRDLVPDLDGLLHLTDRVPELRADCQKYLANRNEDCIHFDASETTIGRR